MARLPVPGIKVRWLLAILVIGALIAVGLTYYNRLKSEEASLLASIAQSDKAIATLRAVNLSEMQAEVDELATRASSASSQENSLTLRYRTYTHSIEIQERIYTAASEVGVTVTSLTCDGPKAAEAGGVRFETYTVNVKARAEVPPSLLSFLLKVSGYFDSGTIESVDMSIPEPPEEESVETTSTMSFTLLVTYIPQEAA